MKKFNKGFTLIELLIVIALLGALAVGLLAALDPFEQLKKGTDTGVRNTVSEFHGAIIRYYALKNEMPWCNDPTGECGVWLDELTSDEITGGTTTLSDLPNTIGAIVATGELKSDFETLAGTATLGKIIVFGSNTNAAAEVCYKPTSKSFTNDPNTKYSATDGLVAAESDAACTHDADPAVNDCLWCVK